MTFNVGEVVRLKSGGPSMTVSHTGRGPIETSMINVVWFNKGMPYRTQFLAELLEPVVKPVRPSESTPPLKLDREAFMKDHPQARPLPPDPYPY